jgi:hypothetical protein
MERSKKPALQVNKQGLTPRQIQDYSVLATRMAYASRLGIQYEGKRNLYEALGYTETLTTQMFYSQFKRQDIANAIINRPVKATWKGDLAIAEMDKANETKLEETWKELVKTLSLKAVFSRVDRLTGLGRFGILLLGFDDVANREQFRLPVNGTKRNLLYVKALGEKDVTINTYVTDTNDPRFGKPQEYNVNLINPTGDSYTINVHYTRVIHIVDEPLDNDTFGTPRLEVVFNRLQDLEKIVGGSGEMFWRGARPGYQGKVDPDFVMGEAERGDLDEQIDEYEHNLRRMFVNEGVELKGLETQISDPTAHVDIQLQMISAVTNIPKRILTGSERAALSSTEDADEWNSFIQERRDNFAEPSIVRAFVDVCLKYGILPKPTGGEYSVIWSDLFAQSELEQTTIGKTRAEALRAYGSDPIAQSIVPPKAFFEFFLGLKQDQIDLIMQMSKEGIDTEQQDLAGTEEDQSDEEDLNQEPTNNKRNRK